jgi:lipopolysaccharide biosynthesis glycosyltransferase
MIPVYIGYDPREPVAFHACASSIIRRSSQPVSIIPLYLPSLQGYVEKHKDGSNQFIYSRFLVPLLQGFEGHAIFMDGDMIVKDDIAKLWELRDSTKGVQVVKHNYRTKHATKYLGNKNEDYPKKNWSSVILWNCSHFPNKKLTAEYVQNASGAHLHRFEWLDEERIGEIPMEWNWLVEEYPHNNDAKLLHYTLGSPCFKDYINCDHAVDWHVERQILNTCDDI